MMVKNIFHAEDPEEPCNEEYQVGRVTPLDDMKSFFEKDLPAQEKLPEQRGEIFTQITQRTFCLQWQRMTVDMNAIDAFIFFSVPFHLRANDRHFCTVFFQGVCFLPYSSVEGQRKIFHDDQYVFSFKHGVRFTS